MISVVLEVNVPIALIPAVAPDPVYKKVPTGIVSIAISIPFSTEFQAAIAWEAVPHHEYRVTFIAPMVKVAPGL